MSLEEKVTHEKTIQDDGHILIRRITTIYKDEEYHSHSNHRRVIAPDADVSMEDAETKAIAEIVHTKARKDAYSAKLDINK